MARMFLIKVCGVTCCEDAAMVVAAGADAIGLNFFEKSARYIEPEKAVEIVALIPRSVAKVGVFVNARPDEIHRTAELLELDWIQLHGDEPPEILAELQGLCVIRAMRLSEESVQHVQQDVADLLSSGTPPQALLIDARVGEEYGGTGVQPPWQPLLPPRDWTAGIPLILAGGLTALNVAAGIEQVRPAAVDTASGVESSPGRKDAALVRSFVSAAKREFFRSAASS